MVEKEADYQTVEPIFIYIELDENLLGCKDISYVEGVSLPKSISIYIPDELVKKMEEFSEVNWSEISRHAIEDYISGRRRYEKMGSELERTLNEYKFNISKLGELEDKKSRPIQIIFSEDIKFELKITPSQGTPKISAAFSIENNTEEYIILDRVLYNVRIEIQNPPYWEKMQGSYLKKRKLQSAERMSVRQDLDISFDIYSRLSETASMNENDINFEVDFTSYFDSGKGIIRVDATERVSIAYSHWKKWYNSWAEMLI